MKYVKYLAILGAILALLVIGTPASAAPAPVTPLPAYYAVQGIEIFPGIDIGGNNYGATFVSQAAGISDLPSPLSGHYSGPLYKGSLSASINYRGTDPVPGGTNTIIGGSWTFTVSQSGYRSTIVGKITGGTADWFPKSPAGTACGKVTTSMIIVSSNGIFQGMTGHTAKFIGEDNHVSGIFIGSIQVPTVGGVLILE
jgi:hypothetical protein